MLDSLATLGGPAAAAALLAANGPTAVFAACSALSLLGGLVVVALAYDPPPRVNDARGSVGRDILGGVTTIARNRTLSLITALGVTQTFTRGCLTVFNDRPARRRRRRQRATIEQLGARLVHAEFAPGQVLFEQGDHGDGFYIVESGRAEVTRDGRLVNSLEPCEGFGEVALLGDEPRTATIRASASAPLQMAVLERQAFLTAVTGYPMSATAGRAVVARIQARDATYPPAATGDGAARTP